MITVQGNCFNPRYVVMAIKGSRLPVASDKLVYTVELFMHAQEKSVLISFTDTADRDAFFDKLVAQTTRFNEY